MAQGIDEKTNRYVFQGNSVGLSAFAFLRVSVVFRLNLAATVLLSAATSHAAARSSVQPGTAAAARMDPQPD